MTTRRQPIGSPGERAHVAELLAKANAAGASVPEVSAARRVSMMNAVREAKRTRPNVVRVAVNRVDG